MNFDTALIKSRSVLVMNGSGVAISAMTKDYSYVLTAAHNLRSDRNDPSTLRPINEITVQFPTGDVVVVLHYLISDKHDAAVLLIAHRDIEPVISMIDHIGIFSPIYLIGYPATRRTSNKNNVRLFNGRVEDVDKEQFVISTTLFSSQEEIMGVSGGGVYIVHNDEWILIGLEYEMEATPGEENSWLNCVRMNVFHELISQSIFNNELCAPLLPPFLLNFSSLINESFQLSGFENSKTRDAIRFMLHNLADKALCPESPTPYKLMIDLGDKLLVGDDPSYRLADKKLWTSWIELLVLSIILDGRENFDDAFISKLVRKRRLLYSGSVDEWMSLLKKILRSNFQGIDSDGLVFVSTNCPSPPAKPRTVSDLSKIVSDIALPRNLDYDIGLPTKPFIPRMLIHLEGLHAECVTRRESSYEESAEASDMDLMISILRKAYSETIA